MDVHVYEGSRTFMRGEVPKVEPEPLSELQWQILEVLSDGKLYTMSELADKLAVPQHKLMYDLDLLSWDHPIYEENRGRNFWIGVLERGKHA